MAHLHRSAGSSDIEQDIKISRDLEQEKHLQDDADLEPSTTKRNASFVSVQPGNSYKTLGRWQTAVIFITNEVGIGILSLPEAMQTLGLIPGIIAIVGLGVVTTYTAYVLVQFYRRFPTVMNIVDCCQIMGGMPLAVICAVAFILNLALTCASASLTMSIALNTMSEHALCTVGFVAFPVIGSWLLCLPRKFSFIAHFGSMFPRALISMLAADIEFSSVHDIHHCCCPHCHDRPWRQWPAFQRPSWLG